MRARDEGGATCSGELPEEGLELLRLLDHAFGALPPLVGVLEGDAFLQHGLEVLLHHPAMCLPRHVLRVGVNRRPALAMGEPSGAGLSSSGHGVPEQPGAEARVGPRAALRLMRPTWL